MSNVSFGEIIRKKRIEQGKTLREVAAALEIKISRLSDVEHGRKRPLNPTLVHKIADFLELDAEGLMKMSLRDRDSIEVPTSKSDKTFNRLAFAMARSDEMFDDDDIRAAAKDLLAKIRIKREEMR